MMEISNVAKKSGKSIPSFLKKTYQMLEDFENDHIVKWTPNQVGFMVIDETQFAKIILPKYFKHNKYSSFVRQLNMYNFHKVRSTSNQNCFIHENFIRNNLKAIENIKRKPEKKKKKFQNDSISVSKQDFCPDEFSVKQSKIQTKPQRNTFSYRYPNHKLTIRITNKPLQNEQILLQQPIEQCLNKNFQENFNKLNQKQVPSTGIQLKNSDDNISIEDEIQMIQRSKIPTKFLLQNQGSGIFPLNTGMISLYSMSNLIK